MLLLFLFIILIVIVLFKSGGSEKYASPKYLFMDTKNIKKIHDKKLHTQVRYKTDIKKNDEIIYFAPGEKNPQKSHAKVKVKKSETFKSVSDLLKKHNWKKITPEAHSIDQSRAILNIRFPSERVSQRGLSVITF